MATVIGIFENQFKQKKPLFSYLTDSALASSNIENFKYEWIWETPQGTNPMNAKVMPLKSHENILVFYRKKPTYNPQMWYSTPYSGFSSNVSKIGEVYGSQQSKHRDNPEGSRYPKTIHKSFLNQ